MNPYSRTMWTLIAALLVWSPAALSAISGKLDLSQAGIYFLGALAIAYVGVGIISHLTNGYRETAERVYVAKRQIEELERRKAEDERRRSTD